MSSKRPVKATKRGKSTRKRTSSKNNNFLVRLFGGKNFARFAFIAIFAGVGSYMLWTSFATSDNGPPKPFVDVPERGLIWAGLKAPQAGSVCGHLYEVVDAHAQIPMCTHGPDPAPEGVDIHKSVAPVQAAQDTVSTASTDPNYPPIPCDGDGTSGNRVQGLYVRTSSVPSRLSTFASSLQIYARRANTQYLESAQQTGSTRNIRWVHDASCNPVIPEVVIPPPADGDNSFGYSINALKALGHNRSDRKYMLWVDDGVYCGIGSIYGDDQPGSDNINNGKYPMYARSDNGCWNYAEAHELMHNLGGVQMSAPHSTGGWHCTDEADEMCYVDASGVVMTNVCPYGNYQLLNQSVLFDCNHDDYYYAGVPPAGNYLATHWNIANSSFLMGGGAQPIVVQCNNGLDDDADGKVDYPNDPGCSASSDTSESPDPPPPADTTAPTASIVGPSNGATVKRTAGIYANGSDNVRVTKMEIYIDSTLKATTTGTPITYAWNVNKVKSGLHNITVKAYDAAGNVGQSSITVYK